MVITVVKFWKMLYFSLVVLMIVAESEEFCYVEEYKYCIIICNNSIDARKLSGETNKIPKGLCNGVSFVINEVDFGGSLQPGWIGLPIWYDCHATTCSTRTITSLSFIKCKFDSIKNDSINNLGVISLAITYSTMNSLEYESFTGMVTLKEFTFICKTFTDNFKIHPRALEGMANLERLTIKNCLSTQHHIMNLIGLNKRSPKLKVLDNNYNKFTKLPSFSFGKANALQDINLAQNGLTKLPKEVFWRAPARRKINLGGNNLKSIDKNIFYYLYKDAANGIIAKDPWKCNCKLVWLQEYAKQNNSPLNTKGVNALLCNGGITSILDVLDYQL